MRSTRTINIPEWAEKVLEVFKDYNREDYYKAMETVGAWAYRTKRAAVSTL